MKFIRFDSPSWLILLPITLILWIFLNRKMISLKGQKPTGWFIKPVIIGIISLALADPKLLLKTWNQSIIFIADLSESVKGEERLFIRDYLQAKIREKKPGQSIGIIRFGEKSDILVPPLDLSENLLSEKISHLTESDVGSQYTDIEDAMNAATTIFPDNLNKRIVLISDGNENSGDSAKLISELKAREIQVDALPIGGMNHGEVALESIYAPLQLRKDSPFFLEMSVNANTKTSFRTKIQIDQKLVYETDNMDINPGDHQVFKIPLVLHETGIHSISANLIAEKDQLFINNNADTTSFIVGRPKVLFVEDRSLNNPDYLKNILIKNGIEAESRYTDDLYSKPAGFSGYDAVILNDIPSRSLSIQQMQAISAAVHDLGIGLILVSGKHISGRMGYTRTPIEASLPVNLSPPTGKDNSSVDIVLLLDKSGSMSEEEYSKIKIVLNASQSIIDTLDKEDRLGVVAFDSDAHVIASFDSIKNQGEMLKKIQGILPRGGTLFYPAFDQAKQWLKNSEASYKHIILISDGKTEVDDYFGLIQEMAGNNVTISAIGIGKDSNIPLLKNITQKGKGRFYKTEDNFSELSEILRMDTFMTTNTFYVEKRFDPRVKDSDPMLNGISPQLPSLYGYMITSPKKTAIIPITSDKGDPIVGIWRYGLGKGSIITTDDGSLWARDWTKWDSFGKLWVQLVKRTMQSQSEGEGNLLTQVKGNEVTIQYQINELDNLPLNVKANIIKPDGKPIDIKLSQSSPGIYKGKIDNLTQGSYYMLIMKDDPEQAGVLERGRFIINQTKEYMNLNRNMRLLEEITSNTGGKIISREEPLSNSKAGEGIKQYIPVWPYLFMVAVILFLIDVAIYRGFTLSLRRNRGRNENRL